MWTVFPLLTGRFFRIFLEGFLTCFQKGLDGLFFGVYYLIHSIGKFQVESTVLSIMKKINLFG